MNNDYSEIKRAAEQRKSELEHFGMPGSFSVDPKILLDLIADAERLSWLDKQVELVIDNRSYAQPEGEVVANRWTVEEPCSDIRGAIDQMCRSMQP